MSTDQLQIDSELAAAGGRLEWATKFGIGVSFSSPVSADVLSRIPKTIESAVWICLEDGAVTDAGLSWLEKSPVLEHIRLSGTQVTAAGIRQLLAAVPSIQQVDLSSYQITMAELEALQTGHPQIRFVQSSSGLPYVIFKAGSDFLSRAIPDSEIWVPDTSNF